MQLRRARLVVLATVLFLLHPAPPSSEAQTGALTCDAEMPLPQGPRDLALCTKLAPVIRDPSALPLGEYEEKLGDFLRAWCHRDAESGWVRDKTVRDTGPWIATYDGNSWSGRYHGTHAPVVIWYSKEMIDWLRVNRPAEGAGPASPAPVPDGAVMIKEMYPKPAAACAAVDPLKLRPTSGAAVMVRDREASHDGWFWGWFGWSGWDPDWPAGPNNRLPFMGFGQYCVNCHASAEADLTFAALGNVDGEPGRPLVFLSQHFAGAGGGGGEKDHHRRVTLPGDDAMRLGEPLYSPSPAFTRAIPANGLPRRGFADVAKMPSQTYDNVWVGAGGPTAAYEFVTSDQCLGCHDAGSTGLQFDMTAPAPDDPGKVLNLSPYGTWVSSPMGLAGRDPVFFAQLASETETFHPEISDLVQDICLGCHGVTGQRQFKIDGAKIDRAGAGGRGQGRLIVDRTHGQGTGGTAAAAATLDDECRDDPYLREVVNAVPFPHGNPLEPLARYGALSRDGISCTSCHRMLVGVGDGPALDEPENRCVKQRQELLNPGLTGFARTFTGSFLVGPPDRLIGPFEDPKTKPMDHALGIEPVHDLAVQSSELCGSCHTVHLPVIVGTSIVDRVYEQTTYPEWAFSAYREGTTPQGPLPGGAGAKAESCQSCHMPSKDESGEPVKSKIASIQEYTNFPQAEHNLGPEDVDLPVREGYARHTLVGLNVFLLKMAQQFPDVLGIRTQDPMMTTFGVDPLITSEQAMLDQAANATATVTVDEVAVTGGKLSARVNVESLVGHKLPSGVGFRRAFLEFTVVGADGQELWVSGRTDGAGVIVDQDGRPIAGEKWWRDDCSSLLHPDELVYQPHYQVVSGQDQAQIYQELVTAPPAAAGTSPDCGLDATPEPPFTTSFLSICGHVKDNRILPAGFLPLDDRIAIAKALGAGDGRALALDTGAHGVDGDPDYETGGGDSLRYEIPLADLAAPPWAVRARLLYQAIPPYFLEDRFCTSKSDDTQRLYFLASHLNLDGTEAADWKLEVVASEVVRVE